MFCEVVGRVFHTPVQKTSKSGRDYVEVTLMDSTAGKKNGEYGNVFVKLLMFGKSADFAATYMKKGQCFIARGDIEVSAYIGRDGEAKPSLSMVPEKIAFAPTPQADTDDSPAGNDFGSISVNVPF